jgi:hypothetical protein
MQVLASGDIAWLKRVLAHELAHQITFLALRKSGWGVYSELYKSAALPAWFMEGLAQYEAESWDAKRNTFFAHVLYNSALEPYPDLATYTKDDPVTGRLVYEQGHAFVRFLAARQDKRFFAKVLARVRVIPVWNEIKALLSPLTASILPLEDALHAVSGRSIRQLYGEFSDSARAGLPSGVGASSPLRGGVPGFDVVYQGKILDSSAFIFTGQRKMDQPIVALFESRAGIVRGLGPHDVNPVFDLSPDGKRIAFVRTSSDVDGDPRERLYVSDIHGNGEILVSDGAAHPAFLGKDSLAFSHYAHGRQALAICDLSRGTPACREEAPDSLVGFYALSRSARGLLLNATDSAGKTGIYEYAPGAGFASVYRDGPVGEFPVESPDGQVLMLRDREGLMQVDALDRATGRIATAATFPLGTFYLHRAGIGIAASVVQTGSPGHWGLQPVTIAPPALPASLSPASPEGIGMHASADSATASDSVAGVDSAATADNTTPERAAPADTVVVYRKPGFLVTKPPEFPAKGSPGPERARSYNSLLGIRPLYLAPFITSTLEGAAFGASVYLQDPLELHTLSVMGALGPSHDLYGISYFNQQMPAGISLSATNSYFSTDPLPKPDGWKEFDLVTTADVFSAGVNIPFPAPANSFAGLGLRVTDYFKEYRFAGQASGHDYDVLKGWSDSQQELDRQIFLGFTYDSPYAYDLVHPLWMSDVEGGIDFKDYGPDFFYYVRETLPLWRELTFTARWEGEFLNYDLQAVDANPPLVGPVTYFRGGRSGNVEDGYAGLDFPLYKGFIGEMPVLGLWNYLGGGFFGSYHRREYDKQIVDNRYLFAAHDSVDVVIGAKVSGLFHFMRRLPFALSFQAGYDLGRESQEYRFSIETSGIPVTVSLHPDFVPGLGNARRREP